MSDTVAPQDLKDARVCLTRAHAAQVIMMGVIGGALAFNGSSDYVSLGTIIGTGSYTKAAWIKPESNPATYGQNILSGKPSQAFAQGQVLGDQVGERVLLCRQSGFELPRATHVAGMEDDHGQQPGEAGGACNGGDGVGFHGWPCRTGPPARILQMHQKRQPFNPKA